MPFNVPLAGHSPAWTPGDPVHDMPAPVAAVDEACLAMTRHGGGRPMHWVADEAVPAPWQWLCGQLAGP